MLKQQTEIIQIDILLSTYNGGKYLLELLRSIADQSYKHWRLIIRDDGSTDDTIAVIQTYLKLFPEKTIFVVDQSKHLGPSQSFSKLMEYSDARFIMFCDQDDIWLSNKVEITLNIMLLIEREAEYKPILVHTDLIVVDKDIKVISNSFWNFQGINPTYKGLKNLLIQNVATGCTVMINQKLKELAHPIPDVAIMHDWWIALVASMYSGIYEINTASVLYRQHGNNSIGAEKYSLRYFLKRYTTASESINKIIKQGHSISIYFGSELDYQQSKMLDSFLSLSHTNIIIRLKNMFTYGFRKHGVLRNLGFIFTMFLLKQDKR